MTFFFLFLVLFCFVIFRFGQGTHTSAAMCGCLLSWSRTLTTLHADVFLQWNPRRDHSKVARMQDTCATQIALVAMLQKGRNKLTVVGDDAQSIYAFRGACSRAFQALEEQLEAPRRNLPLEWNYRSTADIVAARAELLRLFVIPEQHVVLSKDDVVAAGMDQYTAVIVAVRTAVQRVAAESTQS